MTHDPGNGNGDPLDRVIAQVHSLPIPEVPSRELLLERIPRPFETEHAAGQPATVSTKAWRRRWAVPLAVAATLLFALVASMAVVNGSRSALASVIESTLKYQLVKYRIHERAKFTEELLARYRGGDSATEDYTVYADLKTPRMRLVRPIGPSINGVAEQGGEHIIDYGADRTLVLWRFDLILSEHQTVEKRQRQAIEMLRKQNKTHDWTAKVSRAPKPSFFRPYQDMGRDVSFLDTLRALQADRSTAESQEELDGRTTTRYLLRQGDWTSTLWVDPKSKLPVRIEYDLVGPTVGESFVSRKWIYTEFEWDPKVEDIDALFDTTVPAGYTIEDYTKDKTDQ